MATNLRLSSALKGNKNAAGKRGFKSAAKAAAGAAGAAVNKRPMLKAGLIGTGIAAAAVGKGVALVQGNNYNSGPAKAQRAVRKTVRKIAKAVKPG